MAQGIVKCELCVKDEDGIWFCKNCHQSLCEGCKTSHLRANVSKHHEIISRKDMFQTQGEAARHVDEYCKTHNKEIYILFCKKCQCLVCRICLTGKHAEHSVLTIEDVFREQRKRGETCIKKLSRGVPTQSTELYETIAKELEEEARKMKAEVDIAKNAMLQEAKDHCQNTDKDAMQSKERAETALIKLNRSLQGNKISEIMEAVQLCDSIQENPALAVSVVDGKLTFVPGSHNVEEISKLFGQLALSRYSKEELRGYNATYADLDVNTMCLRYNFPEELREDTSEPIAQLTGPRPFSQRLKAFSIKIKNEGESKYIAIGMVPKDYGKFKLPGWGKHSYGYHADDGGVFAEDGGSCKDTEECFEGDTMKCSFDVATGDLTFYRNGHVVFRKIVSTKQQYFPMVALESCEEEVLLLEKEPWFL